ncbi:protein of unknown function DUF1501 [Planctopirus limnophila DSM 3776]|uniref:Twin-arginine translocation pathway signal n=1 Tax=Planctopirus limnophila (strain ATCC 43296 / DSM 3776 / IFAM 1008 / Mu 290) TaxID=521674 RepID=D5SN10_PLAL2|nr:DUF1501 domain-containing protein [Planctopirus limnophila]ADG70043.1 protein of unknown function DUF1501 [Planctopirus limnophila DSM 3776]
MAISFSSRREFLKQAGLLTAWSLTLPQFVVQSRQALAHAPIEGLPDDRILVLVQLAGGNDGLNTLVPYGDDLYYKARPKLSVAQEDVLRIDDYCGFHSEMYALRELWEDGLLSLIQGVGYPNPDRSHFRSTEIWETASGSEKNIASGWIGRYFDSECSKAATPTLGVQLGERTAQTFAGDHPRVVTLSNPQLFQFSGGSAREDELAKVHVPSVSANSSLAFLQRTGNDVLSVSRQLSEKVRLQPTTRDYLPYQFSQTLRLVAKMIAAEVPTRVYYVSLPGFDHHATQKMRHAMLLQELSESLSSFVRDLKNLGHLDRTLIVTFSEFGRRVAENQSEGTDHGTANLMFMAGGTSRAGFHGTRSDLARLDDVGDLHHTTDFRSVYASILKDWLGANPASILDPSILPMAGILG